VLECVVFGLKLRLVINGELMRLPHKSYRQIGIKLGNLHYLLSQKEFACEVEQPGVADCRLLRFFND
jgi:hypothetical protein